MSAGKNRSSYWAHHLCAFSFFGLFFFLFLFMKALNLSNTVDKSVAVGVLGVQVMCSICNLLHAAGIRVQAEPGWLKGDAPLLLSTIGQMDWFNVQLSLEGVMESGNLCVCMVQTDWDPCLSVSVTHLLSQRSPVPLRNICATHMHRDCNSWGIQSGECGWRRTHKHCDAFQRQCVRKRHLLYRYSMRFECVCGEGG